VAKKKEQKLLQVGTKIHLHNLHFQKRSGFLRAEFCPAKKSQLTASVSIRVLYKKRGVHGDRGKNRNCVVYGLRENQLHWRD